MRDPYMTCPDCDGTGRVYFDAGPSGRETECAECRGEGTVPDVALATLIDEERAYRSDIEWLSATLPSDHGEGWWLRFADRAHCIRRLIETRRAIRAREVAV